MSTRAGNLKCATVFRDQTRACSEAARERRVRGGACVEQSRVSVDSGLEFKHVFGSSEEQY